MAEESGYDAILVVSFGGPEGPDDVVPFLENVLRGKNVPRERLREVAEHYRQFGGVSPLNAQNRALIAALVNELNAHESSAHDSSAHDSSAHGPSLPVYWGNRNWHPLLPDTLRQMADDGIHRALAFFTSAYSSYSSCRQYLEDIRRAQVEVGPNAPKIDKLRAYYNHPNFIAAVVERLAETLEEVPPARRTAAHILYTAHSIPASMADNCQYEAQLRETCRLVSDGVGHVSWQLAFQSRSGPPSQAWLEPDVCDALRDIGKTGKIRDVIIVPVGFVSDHMEVIYDLDMQAKNVCDEIGLSMLRAATVGAHPRFVQMIRQLIEERTGKSAVRPALGEFGPRRDVCPDDCCLYTPSAGPGRQAGRG